MRKLIACAAIAGLSIGWLAYAQTRRSRAERAKLQRQVRNWEIVRPVVRGARGAAAAGTPLVSQISMRVLQKGGNAVDAGIAALFAAAVTEFSHFGFGGEAPLLIRTADGKVHCIAGVGTAPQAMTLEFFANRRPDPEFEKEAARRDHKNGPIPSYGILPALVPGMVDAGLLALRQFGTLPFHEAAQAALEYAEGHPIDEIRAGSIARAAHFLKLFPTSREVFAPQGRFPRPGDVFRQPDLARTIRAMMGAERKALAAGKSRAAAIEAVRDYFYRGPVAREIAAYVEANGGLLRYEDFAAFRLEVEEPLTTSFHEYEIYKGDFWTQGAVMIEALNILEGYDLQALGWNSPEYIHYLVEALKLAYADRDAWYADPLYAPPPRDLLSKEYAAARRRTIDPARSSRTFRPGKFGPGEPPHPSRFPGRLRPLPDALASKDTTCINVATPDGMMFSATPSGAWMPSVIAGSTGIPLTQRAQSFLIVEGHPNAAAPGKRPRITLTPTLVTRRGKPFMALSTPGGDQQEQALLQVLLAAALFYFNPQAAVEAPRFQTKHLVASFDDHAMEPNKLLLDERMPAAVVERLAALGHDIERRGRRQSGAAPTALKILENGVIEAGADPYAFRYADAW